MAGCGCSGSIGATAVANEPARLQPHDPGRWCGNHDEPASPGQRLRPEGVLLRPDAPSPAKPPAEGCECGGGCGCGGSCGCGGPAAEQDGLIRADVVEEDRFPAPGTLGPMQQRGVQRPAREAAFDRAGAERILAGWVRGSRAAKRIPAESAEPPPQKQQLKFATTGTILRASPLEAMRMDIDPTAALIEAFQAALHKRKAGTAPNWILIEGAALGADPQEAGFIHGPNNHLEFLLPEASSPAFEICYRSECYTIPEGSFLDAWTLEYLGYYHWAAYSLVTPANEVLGALCSTLVDDYFAAGGTWAQLLAIDGTIGCYKLPDAASIRAEIDYLFFDDVYTAGAPRWLFLLQGMMVWTYAAEATDNDMTTANSAEACDKATGSCCVGYSAFLADVVVGRTATVPTWSDSPSTSDCMTFNFSADDSRWGAATFKATCGSGMLGAVNCALFDASAGCEGDPWDNWFSGVTSFSEVWSAAGHYVYDRNNHDPSTAPPCGKPAPTAGAACAVVAHGLNWNVTSAPSTLSFDGYTMDIILFLARLVYDYVRTQVPSNRKATFTMGAFSWTVFGDNPDYTEGMATARRMAAYALRIAADWGYHTVHEVGHTFDGDEHCHRWGCCFELAAQRWLCKVQGRLGLPDCKYYTALDGSGDWSTGEWEADAGNCADPNSTSYNETRPHFACKIPLVGENNALADVTFSAGNCADPNPATLPVWA